MLAIPSLDVQQVAIPKACVHQNHGDQQICAALALTLLNLIITSELLGLIIILHLTRSCWIYFHPNMDCVRHGLQIDPGFIEGFKNSKLCRHFVYLLAKLYSMSLSWSLLCIDLNAVTASALKLPVPEDVKTGGMGCIGVSMASLCYMKRMLDNSKDSHNLTVWYYDNETGDWILRYRVGCLRLQSRCMMLGYDYDDSMEPVGISPTSDLLFFCNPKLIFGIHLKSEKMKFVCETIRRLEDVDPPAFLALRACFIPLYTQTTQLNKKKDVSAQLETACGSTGILSVERPDGRQEDGGSVEVIDVKLYDSIQFKRKKMLNDSMQDIPSPSLVYPSEIMGMHLELEEMKKEKNLCI